MTTDLRARVQTHRDTAGSKFATKYKLKDLVYYEVFNQIREAIQREKALKKWHREWKIRLIQSVNPDMRDLSQEIPWTW